MIKTNEERQLAFAVHQAVELLESRANLIADYAEKVKHYADRVRKGDPPGGIKVTRSDILSWATRDIENLISNLNFSQLVRASGNLAIAENRISEK